MSEIIVKGLPSDEEILLEEATITYVQNPDCTEDRDGDWQSITISTRDNGVDKFLHIKTNGWSLDNNINDVLDDFKKRIGYDETKS
jgi:hypothetical protein